MNDSTVAAALRAYAAMINTLDLSRLEPHLAEDLTYRSPETDGVLASKQAFLSYIEPKLAALRQAGVSVFAELGSVRDHEGVQPCVMVAQNTCDNLVALVLATAEGGKASKLELRKIPGLDALARSGDYPR
jgi:hypothetical protein